MQEKDAKMSNKEFTFIKWTKEEELLVACYKIIRYKLRKLQIANIKVTSLA